MQSRRTKHTATGQAGRHELPFTPKTVTMVGAWQAAAYSAARAFPCTSHASTAQGEFPPLWGWQEELAGSQAWLGARAGDASAAEAQLIFQPSLLGVLASIILSPPPCTLSRSPHTPGRTSAHRWPSAYQCCQQGPSQGWEGGRACLRARQGGKRERKMVMALHSRRRLDISMCTATPKGGCKADMCDYVKRWAGWVGSRRGHRACCTHSWSTWFGETKQKSDVQNMHDRVSMLGQYSHRAHRAGHAAGRGSGQPPAGTG